MPTPAQITAAAQAILPELPKLLPPEEAASYDRQIRSILSTQTEANQAQSNQLTTLFRKSDATRQWIKRYLEGEDTTRSYLPGNSAAIDSSLKYRCPECGTYRTSPEEGRIPKCKDHPNAKMVRS
jgi:rubrerythrin